MKTKTLIIIVAVAISILNIGLIILNYLLKWSYINFLWLWIGIVVLAGIGILIIKLRKSKSPEELKIKRKPTISLNKADNFYLFGDKGLQFKKNFANKIETYKSRTLRIGDTETETAYLAKITSTYYPPFDKVYFFAVNLDYQERGFFEEIPKELADLPETEKMIEKAVERLATNPKEEYEEEDIPYTDPSTGQLRILTKRKGTTPRQKEEKEEKEKKLQGEISS